MKLTADTPAVAILGARRLVMRTIVAMSLERVIGLKAMVQDQIKLRHECGATHTM